MITAETYTQFVKEENKKATKMIKFLNHNKHRKIRCKVDFVTHTKEYTLYPGEWEVVTSKEGIKYFKNKYFQALFSVLEDVCVMFE